jgi:uncharacterized membrane protein YphA (DoxX/SURF4 family)
MPYELYPWMHLVGRVLFAMVFIMGGLSHLMSLNALSGYAASRGVPAPKAMTVITGLMILVGGIFVATGWHRFIGAGLIVLFCVPTAILMHPFWKESDPMARAQEMAHFQKDLALAGAALFMAVYAGTSWPMSLGG